MNITKNNSDSEWNSLWSKALKHLAGLPYHREREEMRKLPEMIQGITKFVDVGASYGPYTWIAHYLLNDSKIYCIEANPDFCAHIQSEWDKVVENSQSRGNSLEVFNNPASNKTETLLFKIDRQKPFNSSIGSLKCTQEKADGFTEIFLETVVLDQLFRNNIPDLIKIDVEGAEWRVLDGSREILAQRGTEFLVEIHPWGDPELAKKPSDIFRLFLDYDYTVKRVNTHWHFIPESPSFTNKCFSKAYAFVLDRKNLKRFFKRFT